jgi:hypothetical protein
MLVPTRSSPQASVASSPSSGRGSRGRVEDGTWGFPRGGTESESFCHCRKWGRECEVGANVMRRLWAALMSIGYNGGSSRLSTFPTTATINRRSQGTVLCELSSANTWRRPLITTRAPAIRGLPLPEGVRWQSSFAAREASFSVNSQSHKMIFSLKITWRSQASVIISLPLPEGVRWPARPGLVQRPATPVARPLVIPCSKRGPS